MNGAGRSGLSRTSSWNPAKVLTGVLLLSTTHRMMIQLTAWIGSGNTWAASWWRRKICFWTRVNWSTPLFCYVLIFSRPFTVTVTGTWFGHSWQEHWDKCSAAGPATRPSEKFQEQCPPLKVLAFDGHKLKLLVWKDHWQAQSLGLALIYALSIILYVMMIHALFFLLVAGQCQSGCRHRLRAHWGVWRGRRCSRWLNVSTTRTTWNCWMQTHASQAMLQEVRSKMQET